MSRDPNPKKITVRLMSGEEIVLDIEDGDTVRKLKRYIWQHNLGDLRTGYGRMKIVMMTDMQDSNHVELGDGYDLYNNTPSEDSVISLIVVGVNIAPFEDLSGEDLSGKDLSGANLSGAILIESNLVGAKLVGANLFRANLSGANLSGANLSNAWLSGAVLDRANLTNAQLTGADLSGVNLSGVDLSGVNLSGVDLSVAKNVPI